MDCDPGAGGAGRGGNGGGWEPPYWWPNHPDPNHFHCAGCGCAELFKHLDPLGQDLFDCINIEGIQCFNERKEGSCKKVFRPVNDKFNFADGLVKSGSGKDMVIVIPFTCEVRVKCISLIGGDDGESPQTMKVYKNEEAVDIDI